MNKYELEFTFISINVSFVYSKSQSNIYKITVVVDGGVQTATDKACNKAWAYVNKQWMWGNNIYAIYLVLLNPYTFHPPGLSKPQIIF